MLVLLAAVGAGPSLWLLGPRWREHWPLCAPIVGFALVVVLGDVPSWFLAAPAYAWPLLGALGIASAVLVHRHRREVSARSLRYLGLPAVLLPWALAHYLGRETLTTVSEHNNDWLYYLNLESALGRAGYGAPWLDTGDLFWDMGAVLRRGGWRAGISIAGSVLGAISGLAPHQVDGTFWGVLHACFPGSVLAAHHMLVPRASPRARLFVLASAVLSGPALLLLRMSFASHLAAMPLIVLAMPVTWRGLTTRGSGLRGLAALLLAAAITVLADASPYLAMMGLALVIAARTMRGIPWARLCPRAAWGLLALALVPAALYRIFLSIRSLEVTGYHPPTARFDASLGSLLATALGQHVHEVRWSEEPSPSVVVVAAAGVVGCALVVVAGRTAARASRAGLFVPILVGGSLGLGTDLLDLDYPSWKLALTSSPFVTLVLAAGLERAPRIGITLGALLLLVQAGTLVSATLRAPDVIGVLPEHETLVERLESEPGHVYLMGHQGLLSGVAHEHALAYLLAQRGRRLHATAHPASYYRVSWPPQDLAIRREDERLVVVTLDPERVLGAGRELFRSGPFVVLEPEPGARVSSLAYMSGFMDPEVEPDRVFRWADAQASLIVDLPAEDACLVADVRGTPDGNATGLRVVVRPLARLEWAPALDVVLSEEMVPLTYDWTPQVFARAGGLPQAVHVAIEYVGGRSAARVDQRPIHFALGNLAVRMGEACGPTPRP
ncbi:MAG: hypothetical protein OHK0013_19800 [Sandaracinaceae bacterium]